MVANSNPTDPTPPPKPKAQKGGSWGLKLGGHFFNLVHGGTVMTVFREQDGSDGVKVDTIPFKGDETDPREDMAKHAASWLRRALAARRA